MRHIPTALVFALATIVPATTTYAQQTPSLQMRLAARRQLEQAKFELRYYWQVEYPRKCRELDGLIELTRAAIANNYSLLREYQPYTSFSTRRAIFDHGAESARCASEKMNCGLTICWQSATTWYGSMAISSEAYRHRFTKRGSKWQSWKPTIRFQPHRPNNCQHCGNKAALCR